MIIKEFYRVREDGVNLYYFYSDHGFKMRQVDTGEIYEDSIDVEDSPHTYEETDEPVMLYPIDAQTALNIVFGEEDKHDQTNSE